GLSVALAIYVNGQRSGRVPEPVAQEPASLTEPVKEQGRVEQSVPKPGGKTPDSRFDFYDMLPNFEVIIPEQEKEVRTDTAAKAVVTPGVYVLQVGSFTNYADADRRRAQLALQGIESSIQRVVIDDKTYHRVRIGPIDDLDKLNMLRSRLRAANIDALRIRLSD
ncbi:MAG TPA: SPOR domain-containing protein, partial [Woeseiaceae bacterium]|nr:SPOR domain-containing protein [Woeseiaceae bacterium]